jgi:hypothetical protein
VCQATKSSSKQLSSKYKTGKSEASNIKPKFKQQKMYQAASESRIKQQCSAFQASGTGTFTLASTTFQANISSKETRKKTKSNQKSQTVRDALQQRRVATRASESSRQAIITYRRRAYQMSSRGNMSSERVGIERKASLFE